MKSTTRKSRNGSLISTEWAKCDEKFDVVLIGTLNQLRSLVEKLRAQSLNLDSIAALLETALNAEADPKTNWNKDFPPMHL